MSPSLQGQLGTTTDPNTLVRGSVESVLADAQDLRTRADELMDEVDGPVTRTVPTWTGGTSEASAINRRALADALTGVADVYRTVASVLEAHADVLRWAQSEAQVAIDLWARGAALASESGVAAWTLRPRSSGAFTQPQSFPEADAGAPWRQQAEEVLATARRELRSSGQAAARVLDEFSNGLPDGQFHFDQFLAGIGDWIAGVATLVWRFNSIRATIDHDAFFRDSQELVQGVWETGAALTDDPIGTVPLLVNTRLMHDNPGRWWGQLFPDIALTAAGGAGVLSRSGWLGHHADDLLELSHGPYPAGSPWVDAAAREQWVDDLLNGPDAHPQTSGAPWADYQRRVIGDLEVDLRGGGEQIRADGVALDPDAVVAVDAKFTGSVTNSPYAGTASPRMLDVLLKDFDDEIRRYGLVMADPDNPVARLRIIANTPESVEFLTARAESILGDGANVVGVLEP